MWLRLLVEMNGDSEESKRTAGEFSRMNTKLSCLKNKIDEQYLPRRYSLIENLIVDEEAEDGAEGLRSESCRNLAC